MAWSYVLTYSVVAVHVEAGTTERVKAALQLAKSCDAILIGVAAEMWQPPVLIMGPEVGISAEMLQAARGQIEKDLKAAESLFTELTDGKGVRTAWRSAVEFPHAVLCNAANIADLIVVGSLDPYSVGVEYSSVNPGDVLIGAGKPILVVPKGIREINAKKIVVAWKNTREARRALADALPLLVKADSVLLTQVRERNGDNSLSDASFLLSRHGVKASTDSRETKAPTVGEELVQCASGFGADLIVAGAFGRSRLREWVFGGVTRELLGQRSIACLFSH
jgi:nucleotide-binding universal stress UspA family protein